MPIITVPRICIGWARTGTALAGREPLPAGTPPGMVAWQERACAPASKDDVTTALLRSHQALAGAARHYTVGLALMLLLATAAGHGTLVLGSVSLSPDPPVAGHPLVITVDLATSGGAPVEGAKLVGELRPANDPASEPTSLGIEEYPEPYGTYRVQLDAPPGGRYSLTVVDHTYDGERAHASVTLRVGGASPNGTLDFAFPPTRGPRSVVTWLLWLAGLPLAVGVVVMVLVLRSKTGEGSRESAST